MRSTLADPVDTTSTTLGSVLSHTDWHITEHVSACAERPDRSEIVPVAHRQRWRIRCLGTKGIICSAISRLNSGRFSDGSSRPCGAPQALSALWIARRSFIENEPAEIPSSNCRPATSLDVIPSQVVRTA
jgi:hypothetical protein